MKKVNFKRRWVLYLAGLSVPSIKLRELAILKQAEVMHRLRDFEEAQWKLLDALKGSKEWSRALSAADSTFIALNVRRGQIS